MFIAPLSTRNQKQSEDKAEDLDLERREFIRMAALSIYSQGQNCTPIDAWDAAKVLWDCKPEDY